MTDDLPPVPPRRKRPFRLLGPFLAWIGIYLVLDFAAAALCRRFIPWWDATRAERTYRRTSSNYHHGLVPNVITTAVWGGSLYPYRTNALGFRDADTGTVPLASDRHRTLLLGDSFTEAVGVSYQASYAGLLDRAARANGAEVLNAAVVSYAPSLYFRKARYFLDTVGLKIDAIVVAVDVSDPYDEVERYRVGADGRVESVGPPEPLPRRISLWLRVHTIWGRTIGVLSLAQERLARPLPIAVGSSPSTWTCHDGVPTRVGAEGLSRAGEGMDSLVQLARRHRLPLAMVIYPWEDQILRGDLRACQVQYWSTWARDRQVPLVNLFPLFIGRVPADSVIRRYFIPYDVHWNAAGHRLIADSLLTTVVGQLIGASPAAGVATAPAGRRQPPR